MPKLFIPIILGTAREGRKSEHAARFLFEALGQYPDIETQFIDVREWVKTPVTYAPWMNNPITKPWQEIASRADGFIVVTPEYNHGYPGELKLLLDMADKEYDKKVMALAGVSSGHFGGVRVIEQMQAMFTKFGMMCDSKPLHFPFIAEVFDETGKLLDEKFEARRKDFIEHVIDFTRQIKEMREKK